MIKKFTLSNLDARYPCPRCGEDFFVFGDFIPARPAGRFLFWSWEATKAVWSVLCGECGNRYRVDVETDGVS